MDAKTCLEKTTEIKKKIEKAEHIVIGAGAGLSTSAGFTYSGERFEKYFGDFRKQYGFRDMYSGGFYPYETLEEHWAYWSRYIYVNRYMDAPIPLYQELLALVQDRDYFILTTNVDHCFQKAGFDKNRLFYTQGDFGLFQCSEPCHDDTYDNEDTIRQMVLAQGFWIGGSGELVCPEGTVPKMAVPTDLLPKCPVCGKPMAMNLRADSTFVQDEGWYNGAKRYDEFIRKCQNAGVVYLELGVGYNTPGIIKYPFWQMTAKNPQACYVCINKGEALCPDEIRSQAICVAGDIRKCLEEML